MIKTSRIKKSGMRAQLMLNTFDESAVIHGDGTITTTANTWYWIIEKAAESNIPTSLPTDFVFFSPHDPGQQIVLKIGDRVYPITTEKFCKTSADYSISEDAIDTSDDCDDGWGSSIASGLKQLSGSFSGFARYDPETQELLMLNVDLIRKFLPVIRDNGSGTYALNPADDEGNMFAMILLNNDVNVGQIENWLIFQFVVTELGGSFGNGDAQSQEISWTKGQGPAQMYQKPHYAAA